MDKIIKHSSGIIIIDPERDKTILSKKISKYILLAYIKKGLMRAFSNSHEEALRKRKVGFTKGRIEKKQSVKSTALREGAEESGVDEKDIVIKKYLGSLIKEKRYGQKKIHMFLGTLNKKYEILVPSDPRHRAIRVDREEVPDMLKSKEEKEFWKSKKVQKAITELFMDNTTIKDLSLETTNNELEVDVGVER